MTALLTEAASILTSHDTDGDRQLQYGEFSAFMVKFMRAAGYMLDEVLDELIILAGKVIPQPTVCVQQQYSAAS